MKKIINVHRHDDSEKYQCIGCSPHNHMGMKLEFWDDGEGLFSEWEPRSEFMGWDNVLHGGIQATLLDEIAAWTVYTKCETAGVTIEMQVRYKSTVFMNQGKIVLKAKLIEQNRKLATILTQLFSSEGKLCAEATVKYFLFPENIAREKYHYPGVDAFYES